MDDTSTGRPSSYILIRLVLGLGLYGYGVYMKWREHTLSPLTIIFDVAVLGIAVVVWLAFYAQFVLPVQIFQERRKIFSRLVAYLLGMRGPAIFVQNGQAITHHGESERNGPGVMWVDTASGVVTHVSVAFKNTFGPGVHFTDWGEKIGETVDLHIQSQRIGPEAADHPFDPRDSNTPEDIYTNIQRRRVMVSALTRDGIEVVPNISVTFKIDADPVRGNRPGSHFGYDEEAVRCAVINEAVNPNAAPNTLEYKVAWNELPANLAADLWREYMSKFTLQQLFTAGLVAPAPIPPSSEEPPNPDAAALHSPLAGAAQGLFAEVLTGMLHELNRYLGRLASRLESRRPLPPAPPARSFGDVRQPPPASQTALQVINFMIKERMTNPLVPQLDANGQHVPGWQVSREYQALKERGIRVISASVSNLRFQQKVEDQLISSWRSNWLLNARAERERIETARSFATLSGQGKALADYASEISADLLEKKRDGAGLRDVARALLARSRMILIRSDRIHRRATNELQELEEVMQWLESKPT